MPEISEALYRAGEGEQLVLLHGFTGTWHHWRPVLPDLVARYDVIAPTLAGHRGGPPLGMKLTKITDAVDSLEEHLDELGVGQAHFVGNSMGGALAIELARRGRAHSVVALSPGGGWQPGSPEPERLVRFFKRQLKLTRASQKRLPRVMRSARGRHFGLRDVMRFGELVPPPEAVDMALASLECEVVDDVFAALLSGNAVPEGLDEITAPVLLAWAELDRILPMAACSWRFRSEIPNAEFRVLPGVGHVPMWDDTRLVVETITGWIGAHSTATATAV